MVGIPQLREAVRERIRVPGALGDRALPFRFRSQRLFDFSERQTIHHVPSGEPAFAGDADSKPQIL